MGKRPPLDSSRGGPNQVFGYSVERKRIKERNDEVGIFFQKIGKEGRKKKKWQGKRTYSQYSVRSKAGRHDVFPSLRMFYYHCHYQHYQQCLPIGGNIITGYCLSLRWSSADKVTIGRSVECATESRILRQPRDPGSFKMRLEHYQVVEGTGFRIIQVAAFYGIMSVFVIQTIVSACIS